MLALLAAYLVFGEFDESGPAQTGSGADSSTASQTADENNGLSENDATQFQAENTDEEELAKRYYYSQLDENRQMIYRELVQGIAEHQETIITKGGDPDVTAEVYGWVYMDYPEYCWINGASHVTGYGEPKNYCEVVPEYTISAEEITGRQTQIKGAGIDFLSDIDRSMDDYGKIKAVFEKCIRQIDYVKDAPENQTLYSGLVNGQTVCAGYARTFQYLMNRLDIPVMYVTGTTDTGEAHGWNIVKCGDNYYNVDVTWGDPVFAEGESGEYNLPDDLIYYDFLCVSDAEFADTHQADTNLPLPACNADDLEYYRQIGRYMDTFDATQILWEMETDIEETKEYSEFKFATDDLMAQAMEARPEILDKASGYLCSYYGLGSVKYTYSEDTATRKLMVFWQYKGEPSE